MMNCALTYEIVRFTSSGFVLALTSTMSSLMLASAKVRVYSKVYANSEVNLLLHYSF